MNSPLTIDLISFWGTGRDCKEPWWRLSFFFRSFLRLSFFELVCFFLVVCSRFFGLGEALEYRERFLGLAVVLRESGVFVIDGCNDDGESEDGDRGGEDGGVWSLRLRFNEGLCLLWEVDVEGSDKVGLRALARAARMAVSSAACCAAVNGCPWPSSPEVGASGELWSGSCPDCRSVSNLWTSVRLLPPVDNWRSVSHCRELSQWGMDWKRRCSPLSVGLPGPCGPFFGRPSLLWWHCVGFTRRRLKLLCLCHRGFGVRVHISPVCVI